MNIYAERIERLREMMRAKDWDAVMITGQDPHSSEYPALRWKQVEFLTGFTGEAGDVLVTLDHAGLWTDTRYFIQAVQQLEGTGVQLHKMRVPEQEPIPDYIKRISEGDPEFTVAVDGLCLSISQAQELQAWNLVSVPDLLNPLWEERPCVPCTPIFTVRGGESRESKLAWLRSELRANMCDSILVTALDEIAWLLNIRAEDIEYNPLCVSYLLVSQDDAQWFAVKDGEDDDPESVATFSVLESAGVRIMDYAEVELSLSGVGRIWVDPCTLNYELFKALSQESILMKESPVQLRKAVKTPVEIEGMRNAHIRDGVAMERFIFNLEQRLEAGEEVSEWDAAVKLGGFRAQGEGYRGDSFETISAYGPGAALPHYITPSENAPVLERRGLYLCDSGGQYLDGTTDITRTIPLGECTALEREDYTLVLKGHIDLAMALFPAGTPGCRIDALAREPLWSHQRNFGHGTGHGIGFFLCCHEGPQDFRQDMRNVALVPGMMVSDEPGIYREGLFGVRHENVLLCVDKGENEFGKWLGFEPLTMCHFDTSILVKDLLDSREIEYINWYNDLVYRTLSPYLNASIASWLREKTAAI